MTIVRCRVESKYIDYSSYDEKQKAFNKLLGIFKNRVNKEGILTQYKRCQYFESKSQKKKRKMRDSQIRRYKEEEELKKKLRDNFINTGDYYNT